MGLFEINDKLNNKLNKAIDGALDSFLDIITELEELKDTVKQLQNYTKKAKMYLMDIDDDDFIDGNNRSFSLGMEELENLSYELDGLADSIFKDLEPKEFGIEIKVDDVKIGDCVLVRGEYKEVKLRVKTSDDIRLFFENSYVMYEFGDSVRIRQEGGHEK